MNVIIDLRKRQLIPPLQEIKDYLGAKTKVISIDVEITSCIGCWNCWLKTPGECVFNDVMAKVYPDYINSSRVVILFDTAKGFVNYQMKAFFDRTIPHYLPYIEIVDGECHHLARYDAYPELYFYYDTKDLTEREEQIIEDYLYRTAYHSQSPAFRVFLNDKVEVVALKDRKAKRNNIVREETEQMEQLIIYNGSPRRSGSNTAMILEHVKSRLNDTVEIRDLKDKYRWHEWINSFKNEEHVIFVMPLYVHAMPSHVMAFIEKLEASKGSIAFIIQSGFPESSQSYFLEAYFEELSKILNRKYLGTAIKGGVEGLQIRPIKQQNKMIEPFVSLIEGLVLNGKMDSVLIDKLAKPIYLSKARQLLFNLLKKTGLVNIFWDQQLKKNNSFERRFAKPYKVN
jgi:multimeric flavodoxin WrbA